MNALIVIPVYSGHFQGADQRQWTEIANTGNTDIKIQTVDTPLTGKNVRDHKVPGPRLTSLDPDFRGWFKQ